MKKTKKIAAIVAAAAMAVSLTAFAAEEAAVEENVITDAASETTEEVMLISEVEEVEEVTEETVEESTEETTEEVTEEPVEEIVFPENAIVVNGTDIGRTVVINDEGIIYVPVRAVCEAMGMEVQWDNDNHIVTIVDLPIYVTFSPYADGFTFARTAPMMLGVSPYLTEGTTYVPATFFKEILPTTYSYAENGAMLIDYAVDNTVVVDVVAKAEEDGNQKLTVNDTERGEVVVVLSPETVIENEQGETATYEDIAEGAQIRIEYSDAMTMSLPPIANAVKIIVLDVVAE